MEIATGRKIKRGGHLTAEDNPLTLQPGINRQRSRNQSLGVRMVPVGEELGGGRRPWLGGGRRAPLVYPSASRPRGRSCTGP